MYVCIYNVYNAIKYYTPISRRFHLVKKIIISGFIYILYLGPLHFF